MLADGRRSVLGVSAAVSEAEIHWRGFLQDYETQWRKRDGSLIEVSLSAEIVSLLERKSSWSPSDLERYMTLVRSEHLDEQAVQKAKEDLAEAERDLEDGRAMLEKLERKITLTLPADVIQNEVTRRLKDVARKVKMDGFRPGKVPMSVVAQQYGYSVHYEVMQDKVGEAFATAANEAQLRVAGQPRITEKEGAPEGQLTFDAVFEVYPEVKIGDLSAVEIEKVSTEVTEAAIDRTLDILRKQRRTFAQRAADQAAVDSDRVTIDFAGKIDGEPFEGGKAEAFQFIIGEGCYT